MALPLNKGRCYTYSTNSTYSTLLYSTLLTLLTLPTLRTRCEPPFNKDRCSNYAQLFRAVSRALFRAHVQSTLKSEVINEIERFVNFDPDMVEAMLQPLAQP